MSTRVGGVVAWAVVVIVGFAVAGCGESSEDQMWSEVRGVAAQARVEGGLMETPQGRRLVARLLGDALDRHPDASERLREVVQVLQQEYQAMAEGTLTGPEAEAAQQRHAEYWSYLVEGELPPDYR